MRKTILPILGLAALVNASCTEQHGPETQRDGGPRPLAALSIENRRDTLIPRLDATIRQNLLKRPALGFALIDSLENARGSGQPRAHADLQRALAYQELDLPNSAMTSFDHYERSLVRARTSVPPMVRVWRARAATSAGRLQEADSLLRLAAKEMPAHTDSLALAILINCRGTLHMAQANGSAGQEDYAEALRIARRHSAPESLLADLLYEQCGGYAQHSNLDSLASNAFKGRELNRRIGDPIGEARNEQDIGNALSNLTDYSAAMEPITRSAALARRADSNKDLLLAEHRLAWLSWGTLEPGPLKERWGEVLRRADSLGFSKVAATIRFSYPLFLMSQDSSTLAAFGIPFEVRFDTARSIVAPALEFAEKEGLDELYNDGLHTLATIANYEGEPRASLAIQRIMLERARKAGRTRQSVNAWLGISANHFKMGEWTPSRIAADSALALARAYGLRNQMETAYSKLSHCFRQLGEHAKAFDMRLRRDTLLDEISNETTARNIGHTSAQYVAHEQQAADSLLHIQALALKEAAIAQQRSRTTMAVGGGVMLLSAGLGVFILDRRRRQARYEKEAALLETQALRSQMNPHFIFNALNSINAFVQTNEADKASDYLAQFARLMRLVLENSRHAEVPLKDDLDALRGYFELERARTNERFDYTIAVDPGIDQENVLVPPLVLQPFVENAIWHGMAGRTDKGHITLGVSRRGDDIVMAVEDDGRGRLAPKVAMAGMPEKKSSLGTAITKARLDLIGKQKGRPAGFSYTDLPQGTRVEVTLPMTEAA